jgi:AcrR family transcriptional regulator
VSDPIRARRSSKRDRIIATAIELFSRFGAKRVTIEELCREAGASKVTFYKYFPNKVALVQHIHDSWTEEAFAKFDEINALEIPFIEKIDRMGRWKVEFAGRVNAAFVRELIDIEHSHDEFKRRYLTNIANAQRDGDIRDDIDPELLWLVMEKTGELFRERRWEQVTGDFAEFQRQIRALLYYGLLVRDEEGR